MDDQQEQAGQRHQHEDRGLGLGPQAGRRDDRADGQDERPAHHPDDPVVGRAQAAVGAQQELTGPLAGRCRTGTERRPLGGPAACADDRQADGDEQDGIDDDRDGQEGQE